MSREDLTTWLTRFGWTKTGELPGVCENWEPPTDVRDTWITVPLREDASDYEHYMRRAWNTLGRHEGPRLLAVVRQVAEIHRPSDPECADDHHDPARCPCAVSYCDACGDPAPCTTAKALNRLEETDV